MEASLVSGAPEYVHGDLLGGVPWKKQVHMHSKLKMPRG